MELMGNTSELVSCGFVVDFQVGGMQLFLTATDTSNPTLGHRMVTCKGHKGVGTVKEPNLQKNGVQQTCVAVTSVAESGLLEIIKPKKSSQNSGRLTLGNNVQEE